MEHTFEFCRFRMLFNRLDRPTQDKLLQQYNISHLDGFYSLLGGDQKTIIVEAQTELCNNMAERIRNYSGYELCLLYNYMKNVNSD
jgi:hypothetical protein